MTYQEFLELKPGDAIVAETTTGRMRGVVERWRGLGDELIVRWGVGAGSYTHAVTSLDAGRLHIQWRAPQ